MRLRCLCKLEPSKSIYILDNPFPSSGLFFSIRVSDVKRELNPDNNPELIFLLSNEQNIARSCNGEKKSTT